MKKIYIQISIAINILLMVSCVNDTIDIDDVSEETNRLYSFSVPGGTIRSSLIDAIDEFDMDTSILKTYDDGSYYLTEQISFELEWPVVLTLDDQEGSFAFPVMSTDESYSVSETIDFGFEEEVRVDSMYCEEGSIGFEFDIPSGYVDEIILEIPSLFVDNESYIDTLSSEELSSAYEIDLSGSLIQFDQDSDNSGGFIEVEVTIIPIENTSDISYSTADLDYSISGLIPEIAFGYFGSREIGDDTYGVELEVFDGDVLGSDDATVDFYDIYVEVISESNYGIPFSVSISDIVFEDTSTSEQKEVSIESGDDVVEIDAAEYASPIVPTLSTLYVNKDNSTVVDMLTLGGDFSPSYVTSQIVITTNPEGETSEFNFLTNESDISSDLIVEIPLWFKTSNYVRYDTIDFDYNEELEYGSDSINLSENLEAATVYLDLDNYLPFDVNVQVYFEDEDYACVDSLFEDEGGEVILESAVIDESTGAVTESAVSSFEIGITQDDLVRWRDGDVKYMILKTESTTGGDDYVKIYEDYYLDAIVSFSVTTQLDFD